MKAWRVAIVVCIVGCASRSAHDDKRRPVSVAKIPNAPTAANRPISATQSVDAFATLNLGFEDTSVGRPAGWLAPPAGYELTSANDVVHGGANSARLRALDGGWRGNSIVTIDAQPYVGKRIRVRGWIKTADAGGGAALLVRVDGNQDQLDLDNMPTRQVTGTADWIEATVEVVVAPQAERLVVGVLLNGSGTAWFDDLRIEVLDKVAPTPIVLEGTVTDTANAPVTGAVVALISPSGVASHVRSAAGGQFRFEATAGMWAISAHRAGFVGTFIAQTKYGHDARALRVVLPATGGVTVRGRVPASPSAPTVLEIGRVSKFDGDIFAVPVAADGTFSAILPRGDEYIIFTRGDQVTQYNRASRKNNTDVVEVALELLPLVPPPAAVTDYIDRHAIALATPEAGHGFDDMAAIGKLIGNARLVALGEATHGTREFFQLKHRFLEYLVATQRFTLFVIEANQPECRAINDYVVAGKGNPRDALDGIYFWTWNTEEVLAMIEWMRAWNADPKHTAKLTFAGNDMQTSIIAYKTVAAFLTRVDKERAAALLAPISVLAKGESSNLVGKFGEPERKQLVAGLAAIAKAFDGARRPWSAATSPSEYRDARHDVTILQQATRMYIANASGKSGASFDARDAAMAENTAWLLEQQPGARAFLWAHNAHVANKLSSRTNMGSLLAKRYKSAYLKIGFVFGQGSFQAIDYSIGTGRGLKSFTLGSPPASHASAAFSRPDKPILVLDLRALPKRGTVRDWFAAPHPVRGAGAVFSSEGDTTATDILPDLYDALIYVDKTTRARPLKRASQP